MATFNGCGGEEEETGEEEERQAIISGRQPASERQSGAGEHMKAHFPLIKSSENIPFVSATAAETAAGRRGGRGGGPAQPADCIC